jgi:peptidoglycan/LPS O-acetylase OafA/YrhL
MYIFHFVIVFVLSKIAAKVIWSQMSSDIILIPYFISVCAITYLLANLTEKFIEKRGIAIGNSIVTRLHSRAAATAISNNLPLESIS